MKDLGYDPNDAHDTGDDPDRLRQPRRRTRSSQRRPNDGAERSRTTTPTRRLRRRPTRPSYYDNPGAPLKDPEQWQPINLSVAATQNGIILPGRRAGLHRRRSGAAVTPFAMKRSSDAP